ncbi:MAG: hypothetical protein A3H17_01100 [Candidatus Levybacteria bacterium RIFCSPLOWO2_12_FULL_37_14]|nr:MAG: hypothetical protein US43_C0016G0009 [Candidatus Levybacteria bacterium GW2011_GWA1_37_16]KKQ37094.1 MAG: hypothetical protein US55_C0042G0004 [Candidatus Levybacteria bacterium GW2011_GWC2_37_7]KKQ42485.1 MAG: hypothetical protein US59_C0008G0004 [Candidatus Levybacteria bacterium GW2011_GWB1_37_8]OGH50132.1 MAG: hypothetical protein A3H17_01100 [Candidatus Levybacteria bacterium RIFCSPLOWO2_12_FULL_37_14]
MTDEAGSKFEDGSSLHEKIDNPEKTITLEYGDSSERSVTLREIFEPFLNRTLRDGGIMEWKRTDLSRVGEVVTYMDGENEEEYEITDEAGKATLGVENFEGRKIMVCDSFEIEHDLQGSGLGRKLWMERVEPKVKEYQIKEIRATHVMAASEGFWAKVGFNPAGENSRTWVKNI